MYWLTKLAKHKMVLGIVLAAFLGLVLAPTATYTATSTFGLEQVNTGLNGTLGNKDLRETIGQLINVALSLLGVIAVVIILAGGFKWMTSGGSEDKVGEARKMIFAGIIGLAVVLSAWAIALFVINKLSSATDSGELGNFEIN